MKVFSKNEIEYITIANMINTLSVMCAADEIKILDLISGYLFTDDETVAIKHLLETTN